MTTFRHKILSFQVQGKEQCEDAEDQCISMPCLYGATCIDTSLGYSCLCVKGTTGARCEVNLNDCYNGSCLNGGTCVDGK